MKINHIAWSSDKEILCIGCNTTYTSWQDGICSVCTGDVPKYIPYSQHKRWYKLKKKGNTMNDIQRAIEKLLVPSYIPNQQIDHYLVKRDEKIERNRKKNEVHEQNKSV